MPTMPDVLETLELAMSEIEQLSDLESLALNVMSLASSIEILRLAAFLNGEDPVYQPRVEAVIARLARQNKRLELAQRRN